MEDDDFIAKKELALKAVEECNDTDLLDLIYKLIAYYPKE